MTDTKPRRARVKTARTRTARKAREILGDDVDLSVWHPELLFVRGYPRTPEKFAARNARLGAQGRHLTGFMGHARAGIPDGWAGQRAEVTAIRAAAAARAPRILDQMQKQGILASDIDPMARLSFEAAIAIVESKDDAGKHTYGPRERLDALKTLLAYSHQKPAAKIDATVNTAEAMLAALVEAEKTSR